jgi:pyruvate/2-oxoglutarate dehydrogenase complex dihydrolipoamide dehydrogenase (E3) component
MVILGAGPIAVEMAQAFCRLGSKVHVIQRSGQILSREDQDIADLVMAELATEGVEFHLHAHVLETRQTGSRQQVVLRHATDAPRTITCDTILVATGRTANTEGLGLERIGVTTTASGITVDRRLRTSHPHIFAPGDVNGAYQFTHAAGYEGGIVITNALFRLPRRTDYTLFPWCTYTHPEVASVGMNERAARAAGIPYTLWREAFTDNDRALTEGESAGTIKMLVNAKGRPMGIQIVGPRAGELLAEWIALLSGKGRLATLAAAIHPYPTLTEINKKVASGPISRTLFSAPVRKGLKLLFGLRGK